MAGISEIYRNVLGSDLSQCVENSKVLVVGAGGIGCELLKNLVLTGFKDIEVVSIQINRTRGPGDKKRACNRSCPLSFVSDTLKKVSLHFH